MMTPPSTSPCPARNLVALWTRCARQFERTHQQRRGEGVVHDQRRRRRRAAISAMRSMRADAQQRIRDGFHQHAAGLGFGDAASTAARSQMSTKSVSMPSGSEARSSAAGGGAVERAGGDARDLRRSISAASNAMCMRRHAGGAGQRAVAAFERRHQFFERRVGGVVVARVAVALLPRGRRRGRAGPWCRRSSWTPCRWAW